MSWAVCWVGWALALAAVWTMRRRMARVADAEHELRGAVTAIGLVAEPDPRLRLQLARMAAAVADLAEARGADSGADGDLDAGRLAQVLGNVVANAAEHGVGPVQVEAVRLELRNRDRAGASGPRRGRGRGLAIAQRAARELGGRVVVESQDGVTRTVVELPGRRDRAA